MNFGIFYNKKRIGIFPGSFSPPHFMHNKVVQDASKVNDLVYVIISPKGRDEITSNQSFQIWQEYCKLLPKNKIKLLIAKITPVRTAYELIEKINLGANAKVTTVNLYADHDDKDRWDNVEKFSENIQKVNIIETQRLFTGSMMRMLLRKGRKREFFKHLPQCDKERVWNILN
jgi:hypothetical protein